MSFFDEQPDEESLYDQFWAESITRRIYLSIDEVSNYYDGCRKCGGTEGYLARYIHANGTIALRWTCNHCGFFRTKGDLPHRMLEDYGVQLGDLPIVADNSTRPRRPRPPCVVCGEESDEGHHWAPRSIFPDWPYSLTMDLCKPHHDEWHERMRAHGLRWPHELVTR